MDSFLGVLFVFEVVPPYICGGKISKTHYIKEITLHKQKSKVSLSHYLNLMRHTPGTVRLYSNGYVYLSPKSDNNFKGVVYFIYIHNWTKSFHFYGLFAQL